MTSAPRLDAQGQTLVGDCLRAQPGEDVLILCDGTVSPALEAACVASLAERGARALRLYYAPLWPRPLARYAEFACGSLEGDPQALPRVLHAALAAADAVIMLHSDLEMFFLPEIQELLSDGPRTLFAPYLTDAGAERMLPRDRAEVEAIEAAVQRATPYFRDGRVARVASPAGTDLTLELGQWTPQFHGCVAGPGRLEIAPGGQVTCVPNDGSAHGRLVIDRTIAAQDYKALGEPIAFDVEGGNVVAVHGGREATALRRWLAAFDDPRVYHLTELGIGVNPRCRLSGVGAPAEDTHTAGAVSLALGCDTHIGGGLPAPVHIDMTMHRACLELDGRAVVRDGTLVLGEPSTEAA